jgi:hypothetical protein
MAPRISHSILRSDHSAWQSAGKRSPLFHFAASGGPPVSVSCTVFYIRLLSAILERCWKWFVMWYAAISCWKNTCYLWSNRCSKKASQHVCYTLVWFQELRKNSPINSSFNSNTTHKPQHHVNGIRRISMGFYAEQYLLFSESTIH